MSARLIYENADMHNVFGEPISLTINDFDSFLQITVKKLKRISLFALVSKAAILVFALISLFSYLNVLNVSVIVQICSSLTLSVFFLLLTLYLNVEQESLLFVDSIDGVQYSKTTSLGTEEVTFIPSQNIIINEGITYSRVIFYMAILKKGSDDMEIIPIFCHIYPQLKCLKYIYTYITSR